MVSRGYSARQIALHCLRSFVLVAFQWFARDHMTRLFGAAHGGPADAGADRVHASRAPRSAAIRGADAGQRWMK